jgi:hypothetical protein
MLREMMDRAGEKLDCLGVHYTVPPIVPAVGNSRRNNWTKGRRNGVLFFFENF